MMTSNHIHQSNLIEGVVDADEDVRSMEAWAFISHKKRLTYHDVMELHRLIMEKQLSEKDAGHTRKLNVNIGGRECPNPYLADHMLRNWILDMTNWATLDPKTMHVRFERIHPFVDGNGRTGRMLMWWHEQKLGHEPTLIEYSDRHSYYQWFDTPKEGVKR